MPDPLPSMHRNGLHCPEEDPERRHEGPPEDAVQEKLTGVWLALGPTEPVHHDHHGRGAAQEEDAGQEDGPKGGRVGLLM